MPPSKTPSELKQRLMRGPVLVRNKNDEAGTTSDQRLLDGYIQIRGGCYVSKVNLSTDLVLWRRCPRQ